MLLKHKTIIISGVGPGMGQAMAKIAAAEGATVGLGARNKDFIDQVASDIKKTGGLAIALPTDITDANQCQALANTVHEEFGRIDGLYSQMSKDVEWRDVAKVDGIPVTAVIHALKNRVVWDTS